MLAVLLWCLLGWASAGEVRVTVEGHVRLPGEHTLAEGSRLLHAIAAAGGPLDTADTTRVTLRRAGSSELIPVNLYRLLHSGDLAQDYFVRDGDRISVRAKSRGSVWVRAGSVFAPVEFEPGLTVLEALRRVGWQPRDSSEPIRIERWVFGEASRYEYRLGQLLDGELGLLDPGDVISVRKGSLRERNLSEKKEEGS